MLLKLSMLALLMTMLDCNVANAREENRQSADERERNVTDMTVMLNEYLYEIQQGSSKIEFRVDSPVGDVWVRFEDFKGRFVMPDERVQEAPVVVEINAESLDTETGVIGMLLKSESFFDVDRFPSMRFVGSRFEWYSETQAILKGYMTVQDTTRPVAFYVELVDAALEGGDSERIRLLASTTIKRSQFGIHTMIPVVSDDVNLYLSIDALKVEAVASVVSEL